MLFDSGAEYSFISTEFVTLTDMKPSKLSTSYLIEIANGEKVEVSKVIRRCNLELEGVSISIDLIPFGHGRT